MPGYYAKTVCATIVTNSACETTRKISHALAVLGSVMRRIMVVKILQEWISGKSLVLKGIRRESTTFEWRGHILNGQSSIAGHYLEVGEQIVTLNCCCTSQIQTFRTLGKSRTFVSMLLLTQASVITQASKEKQQFRTSSLGKSLQKLLQNVKSFLVPLTILL